MVKDGADGGILEQVLVEALTNFPAEVAVAIFKGFLGYAVLGRCLPNLTKLALQALHGTKDDPLEPMPLGVMAGNEEVEPGMNRFPERSLNEGAGTGQPAEG